MLPVLEHIRGRRFGVLGLGVSGSQVARLLHGLGANLTLADANPAVQVALDADLPGAIWLPAPLAADAFVHCDALIPAAGVAPSHPSVVAAVAAGVPVFGEVELLALKPLRPRVLAISGTNGKSTTTVLAHAWVEALAGPAFVGGNLGDPIANWVRQQSSPAQGVLELSSYQIDGAIDFAPDVAVMLNVTPDHLARYGTLAAYAASKKRLIAAVPATGTCVLNADDPIVCAMGDATAARVLWFTCTAELPADASGLVLRDDCAVPVGALAEELAPMPLAHKTLIGVHNRQNAMAARLGAHALVGAARSGDPASKATELAAGARAYVSCVGLPHRLAHVATVGGVRYLNDSKATNESSAATAVWAMDAPYVLLVGGEDKGGGYATLAHALTARPPTCVIAFGAARAQLAATLAPLCRRWLEAETLIGACKLSLAHSRPGDTVLLSPACASFDAFDNYQHRGQVFAAWVRAI